MARNESQPNSLRDDMRSLINSRAGLIFASFGLALGVDSAIRSYDASQDEKIRETIVWAAAGTFEEGMAAVIISGKILNVSHQSTETIKQPLPQRSRNRRRHR